MKTTFFVFELLLLFSFFFCSLSDICIVVVLTLLYFISSDLSNENNVFLVFELQACTFTSFAQVLVA